MDSMEAALRRTPRRESVHRPEGGQGIRRMTNLVARLVVHFDISLTTQNARKHWTGTHRSNKRAKLAAGEAWILAGMPRSDSPVDVRLINCRTRTMDEFNFGGACKGIIDGLFKDRITPDDSPEWVHFLPVEQRPHKSHRSDPTVIVEVYRRGDVA